jgi:hypothetical protein
VCAGLDPKTAYKIAYSSQYVDDSTESDEILLCNKKGEKIGFIDPVRTAHNGLESFWKEVWDKIYYPFHFVPGNKGENAEENKEEKYITTPADENAFADELLELALKSENPYRIGIALHPYADTFSHQKFSGRWSEVNSVKKIFVYSNFTKKIVSNIKLWLFLKVLKGPIPTIGHAEAWKVPDVPFYNWIYFNYKNKYSAVPNEFRYLSFVENVYKKLLSKLSPKIGTEKPLEFNEMKKEVLIGINKEGGLRKRCRYWKDLISKKMGLKKFPKEYEYNKYKWRKEALKGKVKWDKRKRFDKKEIRFIPKSEFLESNWLNFHRSALGHRIETLRILSENNLVEKRVFEEVSKKIVGKLNGIEIKPVLTL